MSPITRRTLLAAGALAVAPRPAAAASLGEAERAFVAEAHRMRSEAIAAGDQPFGAVLVMDARIVGWGPSRVVTSRNGDAHAERVALWDGQARLGRADLAGAVIYATSRPCAACQDALARAGVAGMRVGRDGTDAGPPRRW